MPDSSPTSGPSPAISSRLVGWRSLIRPPGRKQHEQSLVLRSRPHRRYPCSHRGIAAPSGNRGGRRHGRDAREPGAAQAVRDRFRDGDDLVEGAPGDGRVEAPLRWRSRVPAATPAVDRRCRPAACRARSAPSGRGRGARRRTVRAPHCWKCTTSGRLSGHVSTSRSRARGSHRSNSREAPVCRTSPANRSVS